MVESRFPPKMVRVLCLEGFIARPGHAARPGEIVEVLPSVANTAIHAGKARLPTNEDHTPDDDLEHRDPQPSNRDPVPQRRDPPPPRPRKR
jgi:hypothetical protein